VEEHDVEDEAVEHDMEEEAEEHEVERHEDTVSKLN
jgi:hypothetical protein